MDEKTTLVVTAVPNPDEMASVQEYLKGVLPLLKAAGGKLVKRLKVDRVIRGNRSGMVLVMDFDSADAITAMFESNDYAALVCSSPRSRGHAPGPANPTDVRLHDGLRPRHGRPPPCRRSSDPSSSARTCIGSRGDRSQKTHRTRSG
jgi:uncharacterized protein (DUF1330 family)